MPKVRQNDPYSIKQLQGIPITIILNQFSVEEYTYAVYKTEPDEIVFDLLDRHLAQLINLDCFEYCVPIREYKRRYSLFLHED